MKTQWYAAYFKPHDAKKISERLNRKKIDNYFPISKVGKTGNHETNLNDEPLFKSYIFIKVTEKQASEIKKITGIINLVYWLGKPVIISDFEINSLSRFLTDHVNVKVEKINMGIEGESQAPDLTVEETPLRKIINKKIYIILPSLGYKISAEDEISKIRIISPDNLIPKPNLKTAKLFNSVHIFNNS